MPVSLLLTKTHVQAVICFRDRVAARRETAAVDAGLHWVAALWARRVGTGFTGEDLCSQLVLIGGPCFSFQNH